MVADRGFSNLRRAEVFSRLSPQEFSTLLGLLPRRRLTRGSSLFEQGDPGDWLAVLVAGKLNVRVQRAGGKSEILRQLSPGEVVGEMACVDPEDRSASVVSPWEATVLLLDRALLQRLKYEHPRLASGILSGVISQVTARIRETNRRVETEQRRVSNLLRGGQATSTSFAGSLAEDLPEPAARPDPEPGALDLSRVPVLGGLTADDLRLLVGVAPPRRYSDGDVLCLEGQLGSSCYLLLDGAIDVLKGGGASRQRLATLTPGTLVGQLALVDNQPRSASLVVKGSALVLELERVAFERLAESASPLGLRFRELIAVAGVRQLRMANARLAVLRGPSPGDDDANSAPSSSHAAPLGRQFSAEQEARLRAIAQIVNQVDSALARWDLTVDDLRAMELAGPIGGPLPSARPGASG